VTLNGRGSRIALDMLAEKRVEFLDTVALQRAA
jgi:hypothetical protein